MQISFNVERRDMRAFLNYHRKQDPPTRIIYYISIAFMALYSFSITKDYIEDIPKFVSRFVLVFVIYFISYKTITYIYRQISYWRQLKPKQLKDIICQHKLELTDDALIESTAFNVNKYYWSGIHKIVENKDYIFIYMNAASAHIIPKRTFADKASEKEFFKKAQMLTRSAMEQTTK